VKIQSDWVLIVGSVLMCIGAWLAWREAKFLRESDFAAGRVVELVKSFSSKGAAYRPKIIYRTATGEKAEFLRSYGTNPAGLEVGETVLVAIHRAEGTVKIASFGHRFGVVLVLLLIGGSCLMMRLGLTLGREYFKPGSAIFRLARPLPAEK
jgi:hypothetical protein